MLLTTATGQCIRFAVDDVRVFKGRDSMGVRGISLAEGDSVISLAILRQFDATSEERVAYLKMRRAMAGETGEEPNGGEADGEGEAETNGDAALSPERYAQMSAAEQFDPHRSPKTATASAPRRSSTGRPDAAARASSRWRSTNATASLVASFPVEHGDEIMLVTDGGQLIRCRSTASASPAAPPRA